MAVARIGRASRVEPDVGAGGTAATVHMPERRVGPVLALVRRASVALGALAAAALLVWIQGDGYVDNNNDDGIGLIDAFYYATVSLSTTGYGDVVPVTDSARLTTILIITPLRVLFLIVLVGTTVELLTERSRQAFRIRRWRSRVRNHVVVVGYGTKGKAAVTTLLGDGAEGHIVVVDTDRGRLDAASTLGLVTVRGDATQSSVLRTAGLGHATALVVATNRDDTAVLVTLTAREIAPSITITVAVRESENVHLLRQSGADSVVVYAETAGRLLGTATTKPNVVSVVEDLLTPEAGMSLGEREVEPGEVGGSPRHLRDIVLGVVRDGALHQIDAPEVDSLERGDRLLVVRRVSPEEEEKPFSERR